MASLAYELQTELYEAKKVFTAAEDWENAESIEIAVDLADAFSKRHLPPAEYFPLLIDSLQENSDRWRDGVEGYAEAIRIIKAKRDSLS